MSNSFQRTYLPKLIQRLHSKRKFIQVMSGPRQVGKTTMVKQLLKGWEGLQAYTTADGIIGDGQTWLTRQWEAMRLRMSAENAPEGLLVIDEIQKIDNWSEIIKHLWDEDTLNETPLKLLLLGSSRLLLQQGLTESLAGRFENHYIGHWSLAEMESAFGISAEDFVWFGAYPGTAEIWNDEPRFKRYVQDALIESSISKDILMLTRVDKPALMRQLFELGCAYSAQILAYNKMLGQLHDAGNTTTLAHYLTLLGSAGLLDGLSAFSGAKVRRRASSPKLQVLNNALISAQLLEQKDEARKNLVLWGRMVESAVGTYLLNSCREEGINLHYWREGQYEVDFVLEYGSKLVALEVKSGHSGKFSGTAAFMKHYPDARPLLIDNKSLSWQEFLKIPVKQLFS